MVSMSAQNQASFFQKESHQKFGALCVQDHYRGHMMLFQSLLFYVFGVTEYVDML